MNRMVLIAGLVAGLLSTGVKAQEPGPQVKDEAPPPPKAPQPPQRPPGFPPGAPGTAPFGMPLKEVISVMIDALSDADLEVRRYASATLVAAGREAVPPLLNVLKGDNEFDKGNAAYVLGLMGQQAQDALPELLKAFKTQNPQVRRRVAFAIHRLVRESRPPYGPPAVMGSGYGMMSSMPPVMPPAGGASVPDPGFMPLEAEKK